jgi:hypothetical protein
MDVIKLGLLRGRARSNLGSITEHEIRGEVAAIMEPLAQFVAVMLSWLSGTQQGKYSFSDDRRNYCSEVDMRFALPNLHFSPRMRRLRTLHDVFGIKLDERVIDWEEAHGSAGWKRNLRSGDGTARIGIWSILGLLLISGRFGEI